MGQKVHPTAFRLQVNQPWRSRWFHRRIREYLIEDHRIRSQIAARFERASIAEIAIERKEDQLKVIISTARPGILIGRAGAGTKEIGTLIRSIVKEPSSKVEIEVREVKNPETNAKLVAENVAHAIGRRIPYKRAMRQALARAQEKGVLGCRIQVSGRLGGTEIARVDRTSFGRIPLQTIKGDIDYALIHAKTSFGTIGVKVWIYKGEKRSLEEE